MMVFTKATTSKMEKQGLSLDNIKTCPYCKKKPIFWKAHDRDHIYIQCSNSFRKCVRPVVGGYVIRAIKLWNTREGVLS